MTFEPQHTEGLKWELVYQQTVEAEWKTENQYFPIPNVVVPVVFLHPRIIVYPQNATVLSYIWLGAKLTARVDVPSIDPSVRVWQQNLRINNKNYLHVPITSSYKLELEIPWKFTEMVISIWQFNPDAV